MRSILQNYFYPESVAVIGASSKPNSIGYEILKSIKQYSFTGKVYPVNPKSGSILGYKCYESIPGIKDKIDLALVVVPKQFVENSIDELLLKGVKSILLVTAGFKETGAGGEKLEQIIAGKIKSHNARLVGPNCMGLINTLNNISLNATFVAETPAPGSLGFLSQSGALGAAVLNSLRVSDIRFAHFISVGNKADLNENDFIEYWEDDTNIKITAAYLESFEDGLDFLKPFMLAKRSKPCIILKAGRTESGQKAASSHTGAISSEDGVIDSLLRQFGIIRSANLNELFNTAKGFEDFPLPEGDRIAVVTNAGGPAILAVDEIEKRKLSLAGLSENTKSELKKIVSPEGSTNNPVDLLPGAAPELYKRVNEIVLEDKNVDAVISIFVEPVMVDAFQVVESVNGIASGKPLLQAVMPLPEFWEKYRTDSAAKRTLFRNPEDPAGVLADMLFFSKTQNKLKQDNTQYSELISLGKSSLDAEPGLLAHEQVEILLKNYDLPAAESLYVKPEELGDAANVSYPVVIKGLGSSVVHKTDFNGVVVNVKNEEELLKAAGVIKSGFKNAGAEVEHYQVQPFLTAAHEILIGGYRDRSFGPVIVFGTGGKYVEVYKDSECRSAYSSERDLEELIHSTKMGELLKGTRGDKQVDTEPIISILKSCSRMMIENENIIEFDFNPVILDENYKLNIVDARIVIE